MAPPHPPCGSGELLAMFGRIDIYVFDQLLRGRISPSMSVLDAGCGGGRNSEYLMRCGAEIFGVDRDPAQIERIRALASGIAPALPADNFVTSRLAELPFQAGRFDAVICSAVLHFSESAAAFEAMVQEMWRVLAPGGVFFARLASTIGVETRIVHLRDGWYRLPDGSERFLVDEAQLMDSTARLGAELLDPIKTTVVQDMRSMTTWVLRKSDAG